jgi:predicted dienelactone hydrolase
MSTKSKRVLALVLSFAMMLSLCGAAFATGGEELLVPSGFTIAEGYTDYLFAFDETGEMVTGVTYTSSDPTVATVDDQGAVTALKAGETEIVATKDGKTSNACKVTVYAIDLTKEDQALNTTQYGADFMFGDARTDAPELAHEGDYDVGVREIYTTVESDISNPLYNADDAAAAQSAGEEYVEEKLSIERPLKMQIYYPAELQGEEECAWLVGYSGISDSSRPTEAWPFAVRALENAAVDASGAGEKGYPLVIVSHGHQGASTLYTNIEVNLASKGYVVVAINHADSKETGGLFGSAGSDRALRLSDAKATLDLIEVASATEGNFLNGMVDVGNTAFIGHSMGGYTAMGMMDDPRVRAVVASGPAINDTITDTITENTNVPVLMLEGTEDDTVLYAGNKENFNTLLKNHDSYMLVYQGGNHEIIIDAPSYYLNTENPGDSEAFFDAYLNESWGYWGTPTEENGYDALTVESWHKWREYIFNVEPTWDENHVSNINQHFITAFLELNLRGDESMREYLDVDYPISTVNSLYGNYYYPSYGEDGYAQLSSWKGFQPWTNAGLELYHNEQSQTSEKAAYVSTEESRAELTVDLSDTNWDKSAKVVSFTMPAYAAGSDGFAETYGEELADEYVAVYGSMVEAYNEYVQSCQADENLNKYASVSEATTIDCQQIADAIFKGFTYDYFRTSSEKAYGENYATEGNYWLNPTTYGPDYVFGDAQTTAPELAYRGDYGVGVRTVDVMTVNGINADGDGETYNRPLKMEVWYPAEDEGIENATCTYYDWTGQNPSSDDRPNESYEKTGRAMRNAEDVIQGNFPLVVLSHGVDGSRMLLSYLAENLASKGYVVVCIEHTDSTKLYNSSKMSIANRAIDDTFAIDFVEMLAKDESSFLYGAVDVSNTAIGGYSMGGYGATQVASSGDERIKAFIGIAPYVTSADMSADIQVPSLYITGTADQTVAYETVRQEFLNATGVDRYLLVYQNGDHEVGSSVTPWIGYTDVYTNAASSSGLTGDALKAWQTWREYMFYYEPAWDQATLNNINQHFVTAFLDKYLKNDANNGSTYLDAAAATPVYNSNSQSYPWTGFKPYGQSAIEFYYAKADVKSVTDLSCAKSGNGTNVDLTFSAPEGATSVKLLQSIDGGYTWTEAQTTEALTAASTSATVTGLGSGAGYEAYYGDSIFYQFKLEISYGSGAGETVQSNAVRYYNTNTPVEGDLYEDVSTDNWFYEAVKYCTEHELMEGTGNNLFEPNIDMSRAMLVTVLYRMENEPEVTDTCKFSDVAENAYYHDAVIWAEANGIIEGYDDGMFKPSVSVTREQMAAIFARYLKHASTADEAREELDYTDASEVADWALADVVYVTKAGLMSGYEDGSFRPKGTGTRAEVATMLMRLAESL